MTRSIVASVCAAGYSPGALPIDESAILVILSRGPAENGEVRWMAIRQVLSQGGYQVVTGVTKVQTRKEGASSTI